MRLSEEKAKQVNPAAYALQEIETTLDRIQDEVDELNYVCKVKGVKSCSCCGLAVCCCAVMVCIMYLPCAIGSAILNILTCGQLEARKQAKINAIQPDQNEMYAINQLKESLRLVPDQHVPDQPKTLFSRFFSQNPATPPNPATPIIDLIDTALSSRAINKLRPFLETLKANIASRHGLVVSHPITIIIPPVSKVI